MEVPFITLGQWGLGPMKVSARKFHLGTLGQEKFHLGTLGKWKFHLGTLGQWEFHLP